MGVTPLLLLGLFYTIQTQRCQTLWTRVYLENGRFESNSVQESAGLQKKRAIMADLQTNLPFLNRLLLLSHV